MSYYDYQKSNRYFAQIPDDVKDIAIEELKTLGGDNISPTFRGLYFTATQKALYTINYHSTLINRILAPIISFSCHSENELYEKALKIFWDDFIGPNNTFAIFSSVSHSNIKHSKFAALRLKDAVADHFTNQRGARPSIDTKEPDLWINLFIHRNKATISADTSGGSLHRRGYRRRSVQAPMIETLAAAIIKHTGWNGEKPLYDPLCGSGTLLCEAYLHATKTPPGVLRRKFGFEMLPDYCESIWEEVKYTGDGNKIVIAKGLISGSDISIRTVKNATYNTSMLNADENITIEQHDIFSLEEIKDSIIVTNPPYGIRIGRDGNIEEFYKNLGDFLKQKCTGSTAFIYFGERKYLKNIGLRPNWKKPIANGGLDGRLAKFELY